MQVNGDAGKSIFPLPSPSVRGASQCIPMVMLTLGVFIALIVCRTYHYNSKQKEFFFFLSVVLLRLTTPLRIANGLSSENVLSI